MVCAVIVVAGIAAAGFVGLFEWRQKMRREAATLRSPDERSDTPESRDGFIDAA
jgi:hypothetical protein